jgi:DNA-binding NtrC family response regulator
MFLSDPDVDTHFNSSTKNTSGAIGKYTILVVEDNKDILDLITMILQQNNFNVHGFYDAPLALEHLKGGCKEGIMILSDV